MRNRTVLLLALALLLAGCHELMPRQERMFYGRLPLQPACEEPPCGEDDEGVERNEFNQRTSQAANADGRQRV